VIRSILYGIFVSVFKGVIYHGYQLRLLATMNARIEGVPGSMMLECFGISYKSLLYVRILS
jgi:hypothetical protein